MSAGFGNSGAGAKGALGDDDLTAHLGELPVVSRPGVAQRRI